MRRSRTVRWLALGMLAAACVVPTPRAAASDFDIVINEIHYNPLSGSSLDEYLELHNRGPTAVDLSNWFFDEGIALVIPEGVVIEPKAFLLVSPDANHTRTRYGFQAVVGNYGGVLDNGGEVLSLRNAHGTAVCRLHYEDGGVWPSAADGLGPSLELTDPHSIIDIPRHWRASLLLHGTPGAVNSTFHEIPPAGLETTIIAAGTSWRFRKGTAEYPAGWRDVGFNETTWEFGPMGLGYSDDPEELAGINTVLGDMQGGYISIAARRTFSLTQADIDAAGTFTFAIAYDDSFIAYMNGVEFARANIGNPGDPESFDEPADSSTEPGEPQSYDVPRARFRVGQNVLAVQVHNSALVSSDMVLLPQLVSRPGVPEPPAAGASVVAINEVKATEGGSQGFIEIYNRGATPFSLGGYQVVDSAGRRFTIPGGVSAPGRGWVNFRDNELGFNLALSGVTYALLAADGATFVDGIAPSPGAPGENGYSFGRYPDGDDDTFVMTTPTRGAANQASLQGVVVLNEIAFHPPFVAPGGGCADHCSDADQWLELHNLGASPINIGGWSLTRAVEFTIPAGTQIGAGSHLVIAANRARFLATHPAVNQALVIGDWLGPLTTRVLSHGSDTINLRDALGNLADHVKYGDGGPLNDLEPLDGADDGTFHGSEWPGGAEGTGRTIELIHPLLDNSHGAAWALGPAGGTPAARNAAFDATPAPVAGDVEHSPAVPRSNEAVLVSCRVSGGGAITQVRAFWHRDPGGAVQTANLLDNGLSGDGAAGDGLYAGTIPAQPAGTVVAFQVEARQADGQTTTVPRAPGVPPYPGFAGPFFLYQVSDATPPSNPSVDYTIVMAAADLAELQGRDVDSDVLLYCTFISQPGTSGEQVRHLAGIRFRGETARDVDPKSYRIDFPADKTFDGIEHLNLNSINIENELLAMDLFRRAGVPCAQEWSVNLTFAGSLNPRYVRKEHLNADFLSRYFGGGSDDGNLYRALDPPGFPFQGDLSYLGPDEESYRPYYDKRSNDEEDDYSDIIELCRVFDPVETPDAQFPERLEQVADVFQWARFFAVQSCLSNIDGSIQTNTGEDYFLYHVPATSRRLDAGKWILIPWDVDESFTNESEPLFRPQLPAIRRFLTHEHFAPLYYCNLMDLRNGVFSRAESRQRFRLIDFLFGLSVTDGIDSYITARIGFFDENVPGELSAGIGAGAGTRFVSAGATWKYFKGTQEPSGGTRAWTGINFADGAWLEGPSGFGYGDGDDATPLDDMLGGYTTVYIRRAFTLDNPALLTSLDLIVDYDDGFVAYLNGVEVARSPDMGAPGSFVPADATVGPPGHEAGQPEAFDISAFLGELRQGTNVLAIQGVNSTIDSSDFSLIPELATGGSAANGLGCGDILFATAATVGLAGRADACTTRSVRLNGLPADYDSFRGRWTGSVAVTPGDNLVTIEAFDGAGGLLETREIVVRRLAGAFTPVSGNLVGNTTWRPQDGPYLMTANVVIPAGSSLTIQAGTVVLGQAGASIVVRGLINANGTEAQPILFRAAGCENRWGGIGIEGTGTGAAAPTHTLRYCDFEFGDTPSGFAGNIAPVGSRLLVDHCKLKFITANAVDGTDARVEVRDSLFESIHEGVHCTRSTVIVTDCTFFNMVGDKDGIDFDLNGTEASRIERNLIMNSSDDGIDLQLTTVHIRDNIFINVQDKAVSLEGNGPLGPPTVTGNIFINGGSAITLKDGVTVMEGHHNTVIGNQEGIKLQAKATAQGGHGVFHSMIIYNNIQDVSMDAASTVSFTYSDISDDLWPGAGNISSNPRFTNVLLHDVSLRPGSPCIGTGLGGTDMGAIPFSGTAPTFTRADADASGLVNLTDVMRILGFVFQNGPAPVCLDRLDANDDGVIDAGDPVFTLFYLFASGSQPPPPFPGPNIDPTADAIPCN